jgi:tetratricopeptide (TPR) repeat protein
VNLHWQISVGEFFELLRPAAFVLSALLSTWVLASARRWSFRSLAALAWPLATFFLPFVVLPLYLIARAAAKRRARSLPVDNPKIAEQAAASLTLAVRLRFIAPILYGIGLLLVIGFYLYRDHNSVDAHLARAAQAKIVGYRDKTIREYRAALALEGNPHTHKLLGIELADAGQLSEALNEFRAAERGSEPDESLPFRIGQALEASGQTAAALLEYRRFLNSHACTKVLPNGKCEIVRSQIAQASN